MTDGAFSAEHERILRSWTRPIAHMRQQSFGGRLCLVFGAGAGCELGFPAWQEMLDRLGDGLEGYPEARRSAENQVGLAQLLVKLFEYQHSKRIPPPSLTDA